MRILIVDDDPFFSQYLREGLSSQGFKVDQAFNGQEAINQAQDTAYDAIVLDALMPGLDGYVVLRKLRASGNPAAVLMVSCNGRESDKLQGLRGGAADYLTKPILLTDLIARIRAVLPQTGDYL